jgi:hypothetical protein
MDKSLSVQMDRPIMVPSESAYTSYSAAPDDKRIVASLVSLSTDFLDSRTSNLLQAWVQIVTASMAFASQDNSTDQGRSSFDGLLSRVLLFEKQLQDWRNHYLQPASLQVISLYH